MGGVEGSGIERKILKETIAKTITIKSKFKKKINFEKK